MSGSTERLYHLLPAVYRIADEQQGEPLRALMGVLETQLRLLEDDISQLYDNWFIETCQDWVAPYIGELVGLRGLLAVDPAVFSRRAFVANTLTWRRRKGTPGTLEQVARDVTGWPALVVEHFQQVVTAQHVKHVRPGSVHMPHLRWQALEPPVRSPFDRVARTAEVRRPAVRGRYNVPNISIFLWRLKSFASPLTRAIPADPSRETLPDAGSGFYRVGPLGQDMPLFNRPQARIDLEARMAEVNLPARLRRAALYRDLRDAGAAETSSGQTDYFGPGRALELRYVLEDGSSFVVPPSGILAADLFASLPPEPPQVEPTPSWRRPTDENGRLTFEVDVGEEVVTCPRVAVDPVLGRLALPHPDQIDPEQLEPGTEVQWPVAIDVRFCYGAAGELGGGPYDRRRALSELGARTIYTVPSEACPQLSDALAKWATDEHPDAVIEIGDSGFYGVDSLVLPTASRLEIRGANQEQPTLDPALASTPGTHWEVVLGPGASLELNGLRVTGGPLLVTNNETGSRNLVLKHCTLVPGHRLTWNGSPAPVEGEQANPPFSLQVVGIECHVSMYRCITGALDLPETAGSLELEDCIVDGLLPDGTYDEAAAGEAILNAASATLRTCTVLGSSNFRQLELASNCLFVGAVTVARRQEGCVRYSYAHESSVLPRQYQCQPMLEGLNEAQARVVAGQVRPRFTSVRYGQPGYAQLALPAPSALWKGADDEGELGAYHFLQQPAREANLRTTVDEYLGVGLEAGVIFVT